MRFVAQILLLGIFSGGANAVTVTGLIENMLRYHPEVQSLKEGEIQQQQSINVAQAAFDSRFEQRLQVRPSGYYDGHYAQQRLVNPLESLNGEWFSEYRLAGGDLPVYELENQTLSGGEVSLGLSVPLLREREVNERQLNVANARLDAEEWQAAARLELNRLLRDGVRQYLLWQEAGQSLLLLQMLVKELEKQKFAVSRQVASGDLPQIALTELTQGLLSLRARQVQIGYQQRSAAQALSYFLRDSQHNPLSITQKDLTAAEMGWPFALQGEVAVNNLRASLEAHPLLNQFDAREARSLNALRQAEDALKPKLDLKAMLAKDLGAGESNLQGTETKLGLTFSYPLGNNKAKSEQAKARSKLRQLAIDKELAKQKLSQQFEQAVIRWRQSHEQVSLAQESVAVAEALARAEGSRFESGDIDWFRLNAREMALVESQLQRIRADYSVYRSELDLFWLAALVVDTPQRQY